MSVTVGKYVRYRPTSLVRSFRSAIAAWAPMKKSGSVVVGDAPAPDGLPAGAVRRCRRATCPMRRWMRFCRPRLARMLAREHGLAVTLWIDAPAALVQRAHVEPDLFVQWMGPAGTSCELHRFDAATGGSFDYTIHGGGQGFRFVGSYHEVSPGRIVHTWEYLGDPGRPTLETLAFVDLPGGRCRVEGTSVYTSVGHCSEMADFDETQIREFVARWFSGDKQQRKRRDLFLAELDKAESEGLRELARVPLLLALLCLGFEETLKLSSRRVELYEEALDALLKKWDSGRNIRRDEVYHELTLKRKEGMLAEIAAGTFDRAEYFNCPTGAAPVEASP